MDVRLAGEAEVDLCPTCQGLWVDWFDGELSEVVRASAPVPPDSGRSLTSSQPVCPRCTRPLTFEPVPATLSFIQRCGECAGAFIPRGSFDDVIGHVEQTPEPTDILTKLLLVLRAIFPKSP
jgi:Zn-finger nucleic acid-binding protein